MCQNEKYLHHQQRCEKKISFWGKVMIIRFIEVLVNSCYFSQDRHKHLGVFLASYVKHVSTKL